MVELIKTQPNTKVMLALQGKRILSLLVENCGRVQNGKALDNQRKGEKQLYITQS